MTHELRVAPLAKDQVLEILGGQLPDCITSAKFTDDGFVHAADGKLLVPVYLASAEGYTPEGKQFLTEEFIPALEKIGCYVLDPWAACDRYDMSTPAKKSLIVDTVCFEVLMPRSKLLVARLNGSEEVDPGVAAEIVQMANLYGPVIAMKSDVRHRSSEPGQDINIMLQRFVGERYSGSLFTGQEADKQALANIAARVGVLLSARAS